MPSRRGGPYGPSLFYMTTGPYFGVGMGTRMAPAGHYYFAVNAAAAGLRGRPGVPSEYLHGNSFLTKLCGL